MIAAGRPILDEWGAASSKPSRWPLVWRPNSTDFNRLFSYEKTSANPRRAELFGHPAIVHDYNAVSPSNLASSSTQKTIRIAENSGWEETRRKESECHLLTR